MDKVNNEAQKLHDEIIEKVKAYYDLVHKPAANAPFVPGESRVNYAGRVFDENELYNVISAIWAHTHACRLSHV